MRYGEEVKGEIGKREGGGKIFPTSQRTRGQGHGREG